MAVSLKKGGTVNLTKESGTTPLKNVQFGAFWDQVPGEKSTDLDMSIFLLGDDGKCATEDDVIFFNGPDGDPSTEPNRKFSKTYNAAKTVTHLGDAQDGAVEGDDEVATVNLDALDKRIVTVRQIITRYDSADGTLGAVPNAGGRVVNTEGGAELARFDMTGEGAAAAKSLVVAELNRTPDGWVMKAVGEFSPDDLAAVMARHGLNVA